MDRLVTRIGNEPAVPTELDMDFAFGLDKRTFDGLQRIFNQLCDLTDILGDDYDLDRLEKLVQADREERCVLLPCKVGDTVYIPAKFEIAEREVYEIFVENSAKFYAKDNKGIGLSVFFFADDVGKTVFLTREKAEAALEKMKEGDK